MKQASSRASAGKMVSPIVFRALQFLRKDNGTMKLKVVDFIKHTSILPDKANDDRSRTAVVVRVIAWAVLSGLVLLLFYRTVTHQWIQITSMIVVSVLVATSLVLVRRGHIQSAASLLSWSLFGFIADMIWRNDGLHDTAMLAIPGILVIGSLVLKRRYFLFFALITIAFVGLVGYLETSGLLTNRYSSGTNTVDIFDLLVMLIVTGVTIRILGDTYMKSFSLAKENERTIQEHVKRLKASEDRYRALFESANDAILIVNGDRFVDCNNTSAKMFGCEHCDEIVGKSPWEFSPVLQPDGQPSKDKASAIIALALLGKPQRFFWKHTRKDGGQFDAEVSLNRIETGDEVLVQAIVRDVTDQKLLEDRLRKSEEYYRTLVETSPEAIVMIDTEGVLQFASSRAYDLFGVDRNESVTGGSIFRWVPPEDYASIQEKIREAAEGRAKSHSKEYRLLKQDGSTFWAELASAPLYESSGGVSGLLLICRDVSQRREAEKALRESEERFSLLSEASFEGIVVSKQGKILDLNPQFARILGYDQKEMIGMDVATLVAPDSLQTVLHHMRSGSEEAYEHLAIRKDKTVFPVEIRARMITSNDETLRLTAIRDVTERKQMEEDLRIVWRAAEQSPASIVITDTAGTIQYINPRFTELTGYTVDEMIGQNPRILKSGLTPSETYVEMWDAITNGRVWRGQLCNRRKSGELFWESASISGVTNEKGVVTHFVAVKIDITERKKAEDALRQSEERYRNLVEQLPDGVYRSTHDGKFVEINEAMVTILGYESKEELMAVDIISQLYFAPEERESPAPKGKTEEIDVYRLRKKDGSEVWIEDHGRHVFDENGEVLFHEGILRDVTGRLKADEERKQLENQLFQAQKFESIGTLAAGMAHDFNNLLNIVRGNADLLALKQSNDEKFRHRLDNISKATERGIQLVKQLLTFAKKTDFVKQTVIINDLVREAAGLLEDTLPKNIEVRLELASDPLPIIGDPNQLHQVLVNLCVNARDAMPNGGTLTIATDWIPGEELRKKFLRASETGYVRVDIKDTGIGMDEETTKRIFDPFFTTKSADKGTGLGLAVAMGIVSAHQGFIDVNSAPGSGTQFLIHLPGIPGPE